MSLSVNVYLLSKHDCHVVAGIAYACGRNEVNNALLNYVHHAWEEDDCDRWLTFWDQAKHLSFKSNGYTIMFNVQSPSIIGDMLNKSYETIQSYQKSRQECIQHLIDLRVAQQTAGNAEGFTSFDDLIANTQESIKCYDEDIEDLESQRRILYTISEVLSQTNGNEEVFLAIDAG